MVIETPRIPDGLCLYAIGDIHGRADCLRLLTGKIAADAARHAGEAKRLVFLGDYIDRGPESREVIDFMLSDIPAGFEAVFLRGNHEETALAFLTGNIDPRSKNLWINDYGAQAFLASYGVDPGADMKILREQFIRAFPVAHRRFLESTEFFHACGDYFFVHAGVRPGTGLARQSRNDMLWIRKEFVNSGQDFGMIVVHGHSISLKPDIRPNRIGIDTGAFATGHLTCLKLRGAERHFIVT